MRVPFVIADVFAERPFEGNRLLVVPETPPGLTTEQMATLALEINFAESTFVTASRADGYDVRIFTPDAEIPFAGHPTLGTAFVLADLGVTGTDVVQSCGAGLVPVQVDLAGGRASMRQLPPVFGDDLADRASIADAAGLEVDDLVADLPARVVSTGLPHVMVPVRDEATLRRAVRRARIAEVCAGLDAESLYLFTVRGDGDVMARMFDRGEQIGEDPATGSAAGPLGAHLSAHGLAGMPGRMVVAQGEMVRRPSFLHVEVGAHGDSWAIEVSGGVRRVGDGAFEV
jgi:trans-2,3-dihydro-3-hydroxyanthranilate isomerase